MDMGGAGFIMSGRFISFEGGDGCGKSTQIKATAEWLTQSGQQICLTREPGDTPLGAELRRLLLSGEHVPVPECELLLFLADRVQHVKTVIQPAMQAGQWVLCDRYSDSTRAYQLAARQLSGQITELDTLLNFAEAGCKPDCTLWLDMPLALASERMRGRVAEGEESTRLDDESKAFHARVRDGFAHIAGAEPERVHRIDAQGSIDQVQQRIRSVLAQWLS